MSSKNEGQTGWTVHPGEILREEFLEPMGISAYRMSVELRVSPPTINDIVREKRGITRVLCERAGLLTRLPGAEPSDAHQAARADAPVQ